jgi:hypothetical protein
MQLGQPFLREAPGLLGLDNSVATASLGLIESHHTTESASGNIPTQTFNPEYSVTNGSYVNVQNNWNSPESHTPTR